MRSIQWDEVNRLRNPFEKRGLLNPILVRPAPSGDDTPYVLISGRVRFEGARKAGWDSIRSRVAKKGLTDDEARLLEIDGEIWSAAS